MTTPVHDYVNPKGEGKGRRAWAWTEIAAWGLIAAAIATLLILTAVLKERRGPRDGGSQLEMASRYAVGVHQLMKSTASGSASQGQLVESVQGAAKTAADELRAAMVEGEIVGVKAAMERAEKVAAQHPEVGGDVEELKRVYSEPAKPKETTAGRKAFEKKYGWFAELAESQGKGSADPGRAAVEGAALRTVVALVGVLVLYLGGAGLGLLLLIIGIVQVVRGKIRLRYREGEALGRADRRVYVEGFAVYLAGMVGFSAVFKFLLPGAAGWSILSLPLAFVLGAVWPLLRGEGRKRYAAAVGLHANGGGVVGVMKEMGLGVAGYVAGLPVIGLGIAVTLVLTKISGADASHPLSEELGKNGIGILMALAVASVWAPITEELMFRGMLFGHMRERFGWWVSALVVAFVFAIIHPQGWAAVPVLGAIAVVFAGIREWRGSIIGEMTAHAVHNGVAVVVMVLLFS